jgi:WXXGXW repeat (2 copies)
MNSLNAYRLVRGFRAATLAACALAALAVPALGNAQIGISVEVAPPPLPVYEQPEIPAPGLLWSPGYWAYGAEGYFWVPGTWVEPPEPGLLWTPGYWGFANGAYLWNAGYWGPVVGFYGGVNYGFGYFGRGYEGGYWRNNQFYYNRSVTNITNVHVTNVYTRTVVNNVTGQRVSYAGGPGGINARPTAAEEQAAHQQHRGPTAAQTQQRESAGSRRELLASVNQGKPQIAATAKPGDFSSHTVVASRAGGPVAAASLQAHPSGAPQSRASGAPQAVPQGRAAGDTRALNTAGLPAQSATAPKPVPPPVHVRDLPPGETPAQPREGATDEERAYAQSQAALAARHQQERQTLAQQQDRDHAAAAQQQRNSQAMAQMEAQHQQQTQALQQRHAAESQQLARPAGPAPHAAAPPAPQHH